MRFIVNLFLAWLILVSQTAPSVAGCRRNRAVFGCLRPARVVVARAVAIRAVVVPQVVPVQISPDYYFSTASYYRDSLLADAIAYKVLVGLGKASPPPDPGPDPVPVPKPRGQATSVDPKLTKLVADNCLKCHGAQAQGGLDLRDLSTVGKGARWHAFGLVNSGDMPKGGDPLADADAKIFYDWAVSAGKK
jgi:hypothetical protein